MKYIPGRGPVQRLKARGCMDGLRAGANRAGRVGEGAGQGKELRPCWQTLGAVGKGNSRRACCKSGTGYPVPESIIFTGDIRGKNTFSYHICVCFYEA